MSNNHKNLLLGFLSTSDFKPLEPHLKPLALKQHDVLFEAGGSVDRVYFPYDAVISLVVTLSSGESVEAAMVGRDGVVGGAAALDGRISVSRAVVQISGHGVSCDVDSLKRAAQHSVTLHSLLTRHEQVVYAQAQQTAGCNVIHTIEERLARWLLRARDLSQGDALPFTQEFLAEMLGASRTSVTVVARTLQQAGVIKYARGRIHIVDAEGLRECACECYSVVSRHYDTLLGNLDNK